MTAAHLPRFRPINCHRPVGFAPSRRTERHSHLTRLQRRLVLNAGNDTRLPYNFLRNIYLYGTPHCVQGILRPVCSDQAYVILLR